MPMIRHSETIGALAAALAVAQGEMEQPTRNRTVEVRTKSGGTYSFNYATLDEIRKCVVPALSRNGLTVVQMVSSDDNGAPFLTSILAHSSGEWIRSEIEIPHKGSDPQGLGSAITYLRRYALTAITGVAADDDDDGNLGSDKEDKAQTRPRGRKAAPKDPPRGGIDPDLKAAADMIKEKIADARDEREVDAILDKYERDLKDLREESPSAYEFLMKKASERRDALMKEDSNAA